MSERANSEDGHLGEAHDLLAKAQDAACGLMLLSETLAKAAPKPDDRWNEIASLADFIGSNIGKGRGDSHKAPRSRFRKLPRA